jgi:aspartate/methionine/tyrosine aminotransferase
MDVYEVAGLTEQELEVARWAEYDLGSGYPQLQPPDFVQRLYRDDRLEDLSLLTAPPWSAEKQALVDSDLRESVDGLLHFRSDAEDAAVRATFSGSVAVDRAIMACLRRARKLGFRYLEVVTTSPSIDIMKDFLAERADIRTVFVECLSDHSFPHFDVDRLATLLTAPLEADTTRALLLTSPENPTGEVWLRDELLNLGLTCNKLGIPIVVDHCFLLAGIHESPVATIWSLSRDIEHWIGIWDTGKTYGLNGDKLGFLVSSTTMQPFIDESLRVLQFDVSRRQKLFFTELFRSTRYYDYLEHLRSVCVGNLTMLEETTSALSCAVLRPMAGSLVLVDIEQLGASDREVRRRLMDAGVGVVTASTFFHGAHVAPSMIRLALARDASRFEEAMVRLLATLAGVSLDATPR